jgi:hypothetical protein
MRNEDTEQTDLEEARLKENRQKWRQFREAKESEIEVAERKLDETDSDARAKQLAKQARVARLRKKKARKKIEWINDRLDELQSNRPAAT